MKDDIDDILNSLFSNGKLNIAGKKEKEVKDTEAFLDSINRSSKEISDALQEQLDKISKSARSDMLDLSDNLRRDGLTDTKENKKAGIIDSVSHIKNESSESKTSEGISKDDIKNAFIDAEAEAKNAIVGQDAFVKKLTTAFKRPFVMGLEENKPASSIIITGKTGTGRHSALSSIVNKLADEKILSSSEISVVDLSLYAAPGNRNLFIQDMYSALKGGSKVILFENYEKCHKSLLKMLIDLVLDGSIKLSSRYILQKGMLVDAGTALVTNPISTLTCDGQYLIFMTNNNPSRIADTMGSPFINGISDICMTGEFSSEDIESIAMSEFEAMRSKALDMLDFAIIPCSNIGEHFAGKFSGISGINAIGDFADQCYKVLSEYKLDEAADKMTFYTKIDNGILKFVSGDISLEVCDEAGSITAVDDIKAQLNDIVGLNNVKDYIFSLEDYYKVQKLRSSNGLRNDPPSMHMIFTGNPGTGKTTIARLVSRYLKAIGVLSGGQLIEVTRSDLVGRYVGHTAPLTKQVIESAIGGVLFIDEAYSLYRGKDDSFGLEAIDTLVKGMEDNRSDLIVILAGYSKEMEIFLNANSGLRSRFPNIIEFPDYTPDELLSIAKITVRNKGYILNDECLEPMLEYFRKKCTENSKINGNGRMVRNLIEDAILNQSKRIIAENPENIEELVLKDFCFQ